ncbi:MAG TPA: radical SAM family heme chaperone HemW [Gammaproteobacteria bacterium]|nr:radical SAM family heme chaperone HemW [Gammaproteobacteria bacterium]HRA42669.1 radical SAM family heme chaperone HemW [Gammaproteobacteria bacterium]
MHNYIPLSLYIHIPWCVKKCPYCDFNSYTMEGNLPEKQYIETLLRDLKQDLSLIQGRSIKSIFFGGGTPSLFSPKSIGEILDKASAFLDFEPNLEITLEANPGTVEHHAFSDYQSAGITRISLGAQSFQNEKLAQLGRIHTIEETKCAIKSILAANFNSFNIDIMYGLPNQTVADALFDLKMALSFSPPHLSWYNLTIEPNTIFHHKKPPLPLDDTLAEMEQAGLEYLAKQELAQYEISAFSKPQHQCKHNLNYWKFGDYLGIGAGAHAKITDLKTHTITRYWKTRYPKSYLETDHALLAGSQIILTEEIPLEFMLNALRLTAGTSVQEFETRSGLPIASIATQLSDAEKKGLLIITENQKIKTSHLGKRFLNDLLTLF